MRPKADPAPLATHHVAVEAPRAERLQVLLPRLLSNVSIGRAQIAIDQIRSCLADSNLGTLMMVTCVDAATAAHSSSTLAAAIAVISPAGDAFGLARPDTATIVHAGLTTAASEVPKATETAIVQGLAAKMHQEFAARGVTFIQWATDPGSNSSDFSNSGDLSNSGDSNSSDTSSVHRWCRGFALEPVADLDYLSGPVVASERSRLTFDAFDWTVGEDGLPRDWSAFAALIEQTYQDTRDCPVISRFRTAEQTMRGYAVSASLAGQFWWFARDREATSRGDIAGVLILGVHGAARATETDPPPVVEIVYMGLVPAARGRGLGRSLVHHAMSAARTIGAERLILAVDRNNAPAADHYRAAGLEPMLWEQVWCGGVKTDLSNDACLSNDA